MRLNQQIIKSIYIIMGIWNFKQNVGKVMSKTGKVIRMNHEENWGFKIYPLIISIVYKEKSKYLSLVLCTWLTKPIVLASVESNFRAVNANSLNVLILPIIFGILCSVPTSAAIPKYKQDENI